MIRTIALSLLVAAPLSAPAVAAPVDNSSTMTARQAKTLRLLESVAARSPNDGAAFTELAAAYLNVGRVADANTAYHHVMALENVTMTTRFGDDIWSHDIARQALAGDVRFTSR